MIHFSILSPSRLWKTALSSLPRSGANQPLLASTPLVSRLRNNSNNGNGNASSCFSLQQVRHRAHWSKRRYACSFDIFLREEDWRSAPRPSRIIPPAKEITKADFLKVLAEYPGIIERLPLKLCPTPVPLTLRQLDEFRYGQAVTEYSDPKTSKPISCQDLKKLVEWKHRRDEFAPTTRGLSHTNSGKQTQRLLAAGIQAYREKADTDVDDAIFAALAVFCKMRGIGSSMASVMLAVTDPDRVPVFANELFYWLCCKGRRHLIRDSVQEFQKLRAATAQLVDRLNKDSNGPPVTMTDVEKVAFVLYKADKEVPEFEFSNLSKKSRNEISSKLILESQAIEEDKQNDAKAASVDDEEAIQAQLDAKLENMESTREKTEKFKKLITMIDNLPEKVRNRMYSSSKKHYNRAKINLERAAERAAERARETGDSLADAQLQAEMEVDAKAAAKAEQEIDTEEETRLQTQRHGQERLNEARLRYEQRGGAPPEIEQPRERDDAEDFKQVWERDRTRERDGARKEFGQSRGRDNARGRDDARKESGQSRARDDDDAHARPAPGRDQRRDGARRDKPRLPPSTRTLDQVMRAREMAAPGQEAAAAPKRTLEQIMRAKLVSTEVRRKPVPVETRKTSGMSTPLNRQKRRSPWGRRN